MSDRLSECACLRLVHVKSMSDRVIVTVIVLVHEGLVSFFCTKNGLKAPPRGLPGCFAPKAPLA